MLGLAGFFQHKIHRLLGGHLCQCGLEKSSNLLLHGEASGSSKGELSHDWVVVQNWIAGITARYCLRNGEVFYKLHCKCITNEVDMKTATLPALRVKPDVRDAVENMLEPGETLSSFVEQAVLERLERRRYQSEFIARGLIARDSAAETNSYISADKVIADLGAMLKKAKAKSR
jgi:hypothetical protein